MVGQKINLLFTIIIIVLNCRYLKSQDLTIEDVKCEKDDAVNVQCFNDKTQAITNGGTVRRHENILVKIEQIKDACSFQIPEYRMVIIGPNSKKADDDNSVQVAAKGKKYTETNFQIDPYSIADVGKTVLKFFPMADSNTIVADPVTCSFDVDYSKVKAVLIGGTEANYKSDKLTTIDASNSENTNEFKDKKDNLEFHWECDVVEGKNSKFCTDRNLPEFAGKNKITIPGSESKTEYVYKVSVTVQVENIPDPQKYEDVASQIVKFSELAAELKIQCVKNCVPKAPRTLSSMAVILKAICKFCGAFSSDVFYYWTVEDSKGSVFDYTKLKNPNRKGDTFYLNAGALEDNEIYIVKVETKGDKQVVLLAEFTLDTNLPPPLKDCKIDPPKGIAFQTGFQAKCTYFPGDITFELYSIKDEKVVLLAKTKTLEDQVFYLPAGASVLINMTENRSGYTQTATANVEVAEVLNIAAATSDKQISNAIEDKFDDVIDLAKAGNPEFALQGLAAVVEEYSKLPPEKKDLELNMDNKAVKSINSININSPELAKQAVDIISQITEKYQDNPDPELSVQSTAICYKASKILSAEAYKIDNPDLKRLQLTNNIKSLASCSQAGLGQNLEAIKEESIDVFLSVTEFPLLEVNQIPEQYSDYTDDVKASENMAKFEEASRRMKNICFSNAKMIVLTMVPEEDPVVNVQGSMSIATVRRYCYDLPNTDIHNNAVNLRPSPDCQNNAFIDILMCVVDKNPYWWKDNIPMITNVVYTKFAVSKQKIKRSALDEDLPDATEDLDEFIDPFTITFEKKENISTELTINQAILPEKHIAEMDEDSFYEEVSTYRIYVFKNRGFTMAFENMTEEDYYDIVLTEFEKPSYSYFKAHYKTVFMDNNVVNNKETRSYDTFWYISLLPNQKMSDLKLTGKSYFFSVTTMACYTWKETIKAWIFACNASNGIPTLESITCYCTSGNIFTAHVSNNKVNLVENIKIEFQLEVQQCWIIFIVTTITFFLFCVFLFFTSFEQKNDILDRVFFVGDVPSYFQYPYIIVVETGKKGHSGTTSNVMVKLYGSAANSLEHVLNYPDPELVMLQRNTETWFVIATEKLLGDLKKIEIWFDSIGNNTKWYGSRIEVYDIQQNKSWEFNVENWFDVVMEKHNIFVVTPKENITTVISNKLKKETIHRAVRNFLGKTADEVNLWNLRIKDPLLMLKERVAIMFSTLTTMFLIIMLLYNIPNFDESDSIDENVFGLHDKLIWTPILGAAGAFMVHFPLTYFIKRGQFKSLRKKIILWSFDVNKNAAAICWIGSIILSTTCTTLLICCGFWVPMDTSLLWLVSVILGIFFNVLVLQNVSSIIYGFWLRLPAQIESFAKTTERIVQYVELQRAWLYKRFGSLSLRPYFKHLYYPLDFVTVKERIKSEDLRVKIVEILEDLIMIVVYVALLYVVLLLDKEPMAVYSHKAVENLVTGKVIRSKMNTDTIADIDEYLNKTLIPSIQSLQWYGKFIQDNPGMTKDFCNKYLGIIRIRQHRTKEVPCVVPKIMEFLNMTCRPDFSEEKEFGDFSRQWEESSELTNITTERMASSWKYSSSSLTGTSVYFGKLTIYPDGGYVSTLGRTIKNSIINLNYLQKYKWLDFRTRAILIEFLTYNPNVNLFNTVQLVFEINAAGSIESKTEIQTRKLLMVDNENIFTIRIVNVCFVLILLVLSIRIVYKFVKKGSRLFYDVWSLFDLGIVILSLVAISFYYARLGSIKTYVTDLTKAKNNEFVNYFHLFTTDNILTSLTAILVFISTFRLWKLLKFMIIIQIAEKTLKDAALPLTVCLVYQSIYIIAFSICGTLLFGADSKDFMDFRSSVTILILLSINLAPNFNMDSIKKHPVGVPFFTLYALFSLFFITVYIAIITLYYGDSKDFYSAEKGFVSKFIQEKWTYYKTLLKIRIHNLRGGEDIPPDERIIKPILGERYEKCVTIPKSRIRAMALITMCVLRNREQHKAMTEKDFELMSKMIKALYEKESAEKDIFFITGDSHHIDFVDNRKLEQIADICERLVIESTNIIKVSRKAEKPFFENRIQRINGLIENINTITSILDNIQIGT